MISMRDNGRMRASFVYRQRAREFRIPIGLHGRNKNTLITLK